MQLPPKFYVQHMFDTTQYRASWTPDMPIKLGDIGVLDQGLFTLTTTLEDQGLTFKTRESSGLLSLDYNSKNTRVTALNGSTGTIPVSGVPMQANVEVKFEGSSGILFQFSNSKHVIISNIDELGDAILEKYDAGFWKKEWVIVTDIIQTDNTSLIISTTSNNTLQLACSLPIAGGSLAVPGAKINVMNESGSSIKILGSTGLVPLFNVKGIRKPFLGNPVFKSSDYMTSMQLPSQLENLPFDTKEFITE
ncbi:MAG: hypothetical protein JO154_12450 [Chitinophaga sp.]|uniref:hypothetical protein n=1 Tax=Chitinophaga sp. TaxID=1869181 RepID=UPI0025B7A899|nr:hypothetical protein [Chitinophaga sp.]MBV8253410.1 hypothetical protein [Chitinophaga sp.]